MRNRLKQLRALLNITDPELYQFLSEWREGGREGVGGSVGGGRREGGGGREGAREGREGEEEG